MHAAGGGLEKLSPLRPFMDADSGRWYSTLSSGVWYSKSGAISFHDKLDNSSGHPSNFIADANGRIIYYVNTANGYDILRMDPKPGKLPEYLATVKSSRGLFFLLVNFS